MSRYAYIACQHCAKTIWLGKAIFNGPQPVMFQVGAASEGPNSENVLLTRAIWKFLADHAGHALIVSVEGDDHYEAIGEYEEIGGDEVTSISLEEYVRGWSG